MVLVRPDDPVRGPKFAKITIVEFSDFQCPFCGRVAPTVKQILPELGKRKNATNEKARRVLSWRPRSAEEAIASTGESLVRYGLLKDSQKN